MTEKIQHFTDLEAWREAHALTLQIYKLTRSFPDEERFALASQMQRSAVSVTSNIAEGFSRGTAKDKIQFYTVAKGSLTELESQVYLAKDLRYVSETEFNTCGDHITTVGKLLTGLRRSAQSRS